MMMDALYKKKLALLQNYLALSRQHSSLLNSDQDYSAIDSILKDKASIIEDLRNIDRQLNGYRSEEAKALIGTISDMENENLRLTHQRMDELRSAMNDIAKRKSLIDRYRQESILV